MKLDKCPYCGRRLSYPSAFINKSKGEYKCTRCKKESNIYINKLIWLAFTLTMLVSLIIMILIIMYFVDKSLLMFIFVMVPFMIFYLFVPFFVKLKPLKKYRDFVSQQQKFMKPEIIDPITQSDVELNGPMINTDVFNQIKAKRKIITEEETARTKAFIEVDETKKVTTDTISGNLLKEKTAAFSIKDIKENSLKEDFFDEFSDGE